MTVFADQARSLFFGAINAVNGNLLTVAERNRDGGDGDGHVG